MSPDPNARTDRSPQGVARRDCAPRRPLDRDLAAQRIEDIVCEILLSQRLRRIYRRHGR